MLTKSTQIIFSVVAVLMLAIPPAYAAPAHQAETCGQDYSVQADDWLSKLADKFYGDVLAYSVIVDATNLAAQADSSYATISNPDVIEVGWKLCLPADAGGEMMMDGAMDKDGEMMDGAMDKDGEMMDGAMDKDGEMMDGAMDKDGEMMDGAMGEKTGFVVRIENISGGPIITTSAGETVPAPFAPGVWAVHHAADPIFSAGQADRGQGLEALAEDGNPADLAAALAAAPNIMGSGVFNTPVGQAEPGPLVPGAVYEFSVEAAPGDSLSFATMFVQSNDLFAAPDGNGISLFNADGTPVAGDITGELALWDAGTEVNQEPGVGADQPLSQAGPNTGPAENGAVQVVSDGFAYPELVSLLKVTIAVQ